MTLSEMLDEIDSTYDSICRKLYNGSFSVEDLKNLKYSNRELHQHMYFQDYLRLRSLITIQVYHDYLRETLLNVAHIDIGDFPE